MRKWLYILLALLPMLACVGQKDDPVEEPVPEDPVTPEDPGGGEEPGGTGEGKDYFRRSLVLDFTGTWCVNCPKMEVAISETLEARPGRVVPVSVHCMMVDPMYVKPLSDDLVSRFGVGAYPSAVVDLDPESLVTASSPELLQAHIDRLLESRGPAAGIRIESALDGESFTLKAEMKAVRDGDYILSVLVLEDGLVARQTGGSENEVHNNVLRSWTDGDALTGMKEGDSAQLEFSGTVSGTSRFVVLVCRDGLVDNVVPCAAGATVEYQFEEENE